MTRWGKKSAVEHELPGAILKLRDGTIKELPRKQIGIDDEKKPIIVTDFSAVLPCGRCGTIPRDDGSLPQAGGIIRGYAIIKGVWTAYVGACSCIYGAWRTITRRGIDRDIPGMRYLDDVAEIPPGLRNDEWTALNVYRRTGDGYLEAAARVPGFDEAKRLIAAWQRGREKPMEERTDEDDHGDDVGGDVPAWVFGGSAGDTAGSSSGGELFDE